MRGFLVGLGVVVALGVMGFGFLALMASGLEPDQSEVRVELDDDFPR